MGGHELGRLIKRARVIEENDDYCNTVCSQVGVVRNKGKDASLTYQSGVMEDSTGCEFVFLREEGRRKNEWRRGYKNGTRKEEERSSHLSEYQCGSQ